MREAIALTARHLRSAARRPGTWAAILLAFAALAAVLLSTRGSTRISASLLLVGLFALGASAWAGGLLPADRAEGRETWLATLRPSAALRRLSAAWAGIGVALAVACVGALVVGGSLRILSPESRVRSVEALSAPVGALLAAGGGSLVVDVPAAPDGGTLELVVSSRYLRREVTGQAPTVRVQVGDGPPASAPLPRGSPLRVEVPAGPTRVVVTNESPAIQLVVREARRLGSPRSFVLSVLLAGLILGVGAAAIAPVAVAVSRYTSGPTASAAGLVIAVAGGLHLLIEDVTVVVGGELEEAGLVVLSAAAGLAPDLRPLGLFTAPGEGHALGLASLAGLTPILLYALAALALTLVPLPTSRTMRERG